MGCRERENRVRGQEPRAVFLFLLHASCFMYMKMVNAYPYYTSISRSKKHVASLRYFYRPAPLSAVLRDYGQFKGP